MTIHIKKRKIAVVTIAAFMIVFAASIYSALAEDAVVPDDNLKNALGTIIGGEVTQDSIEALTGELDLSEKNISDITGLEHAVGVTSINLQSNKIRDISKLLPLVGTTPPTTNPPTLKRLDVSNNYLIIADGNDDKTVIDTLVTSLGEYDESANTGVIFDPQTPIPVDSVSLDTDKALVGAGKTTVLNATVAPEDAKNKDLIWTSSDTSIATVDNGTVSGVAPGTATITAKSDHDNSLSSECAVTVKRFNIEVQKYSIDRSKGIIKGIPKKTALNDFLKNISNNTSDLTICDSAGKPCSDTTIATGMSIKLNLGGAERDALKIVVTGDGNGDGDVSVSDYTVTRLDILGLKALTDVYRTACDMNEDGKISIADYTTIRLDILGIKPGSGPDLPEVSDPRIRAFLDIALKQQGKPYVWSTEGPDTFDCSGYVWYCLRQVGYSIGRRTANSYSKNEDWPYVPRDQLKPGDLMFYHSDTRPGIIGHIGIYLGNGYHIHASSDYERVIICRIDGWYDKMLSHGRRVYN